MESGMLGGRWSFAPEPGACSCRANERAIGFFQGAIGTQNIDHRHMAVSKGIVLAIDLGAVGNMARRHHQAVQIENMFRAVYMGARHPAGLQLALLVIGEDPVVRGDFLDQLLPHTSENFLLVIITIGVRFQASINRSHVDCGAGQEAFRPRLDSWSFLLNIFQ